MLTLARANAAHAGADNARFLHGHIEDIPLPNQSVDVVISNCVINLSADKPRVLAEVAVVGLVEPVGQFLDDPAGKVSRQASEVVADQAGSGHGPPSTAALIIAAKSRQSARFPGNASFPVAVNWYTRLRRPATTDQDPAISPAASSRCSAG
jgi:Methyltransferase domain